MNTHDERGSTLWPRAPRCRPTPNRISCQLLLIVATCLTVSACVFGDENLALGKKYWMSNFGTKDKRGWPYSKDKDDVIQLTDGKLASDVTDKLGLFPHTPVQVRIDLEEKCTIKQFRVHAPGILDNITRYPTEIQVFISDKPEGPYKLVSSWLRQKGQWDSTQPDYGKPHFWFDVPGKGAVGRYVTFRIVNVHLGDTPLDELQVIGLKGGDATAANADFVEYASAATRPFYDRDYVTLSPDVALPVHFRRTNNELLLKLTLPSEVEVPSKKKLPERMNADGTRVVDFTIPERMAGQYPVHLKLKGGTPLTWKGKIEIVSPADKRRQLLQLRAMRVPRVAGDASKFWLTVDWCPLRTYIDWPNLFEFKRYTGQNILTVFWRDRELNASTHQGREVGDAEAIKLFQKAERQGLYLAANFSPPNRFSDYIGFSGVRRTTRYDGDEGQTSSLPDYIRATREAANRIKTGNDIVHEKWDSGKIVVQENPIEFDVYAAKRLLRYGFRWIWFDSETSFDASGSYGDAEIEMFRGYLKARDFALPFVNPRRMHLHREKYPEQWQAWLRFRAKLGSELFLLYRNIFMEEVGDNTYWYVKKAFKTPLSGFPLVTSQYEACIARNVGGRAYVDRTHYEFRDNFERGILQNPMPVYYNASAFYVVARTSANRRYLGKGRNIMAWMGPRSFIAPGGGERESRMFKEAMLAHFFCGGQGVTGYMTSLFCAEDFAAWNEAVSAAAAHQDLILGGEAMREADPVLRYVGGDFMLVNGAAEVGGLKLKDTFCLVIAPSDPYRSNDVAVQMVNYRKGMTLKNIYGPRAVRVDLDGPRPVVRINFTPDKAVSILVFSAK